MKWWAVCLVIGGSLLAVLLIAQVHWDNMSDDLVQRLRYHAVLQSTPEGKESAMVMLAAADCIEELETLIETERSLRRKATEMVISATIFIDSLYSALKEIADSEDQQPPWDLRKITSHAIKEEKDV